MPWVFAAVAVATSVISSSKQDNSWKQAAKKSGANQAQLEASLSRGLALLPAKAKANSDAALQANIQTQRAESAAIAEHTVQAAAAGAAGVNVEQGAMSIEANAAMVKNNILKQRQSADLQISQDRDDLFWEADNQKYETELVDNDVGNAEKMLAAGLSGVAAYYGAR